MPAGVAARARPAGLVLRPVVLSSRLHPLLWRCRRSPEYQPRDHRFPHAWLRPARYRLAAMLHVLCLPFVGNDFLWSTGLAGTIPAACCFVIAGACFFLAARTYYASNAAAVVTAACFALNPNILYLAVIPMTEAVFFAGLGVALLSRCSF